MSHAGADFPVFLCETLHNLCGALWNSCYTKNTKNTQNTQKLKKISLE